MDSYLKDVLDPCAQAGHQALRDHDLALGEVPEPEWDALTPEAQRDAISSAASVLRGEGPAADYEVWAYIERRAGREVPRYRDLPESRWRRDKAFVCAVAEVSNRLQVHDRG